VRVVIVSIFRLIAKFLKIQDMSQVNKSQERVETHLLFVPALRTCLTHYTFLDMIYRESEIKSVLLVCLPSRSRVTPTSSIENF
jgi:hypothetical protein